MGCVLALALTLGPVHFLLPGWIEGGHHPNYLPTRFLQFQLSPFPHSHAQAWLPILQCRLSTTVIKTSTYQSQRKLPVKIPSLRNVSPSSCYNKVVMPLIKNFAREGNSKVVFWHLIPCWISIRASNVRCFFLTVATIGDKIVDTLTFSTLCYFSFVFKWRYSPPDTPQKSKQTNN